MEYVGKHGAWTPLTNNPHWPASGQPLFQHDPELIAALGRIRFLKTHEDYPGRQQDIAAELATVERRAAQ